MLTDDQLDKELTALQERQKKLIAMKRLQEAVKVLESQFRYGPADERRQLELVQKAVCEYFQITDVQLNSRSHAEFVARPRQIVFYLCNKIFAMAASHLGKMTGRDHATVLYAAKRIRDMMSVDPALKARVEELERKCIEALGKDKTCTH